MANEHCLEGMRCPNCGSYGPYIIGVELSAKMSDAGTEALYIDGLYWDEDSPCTCDTCEYVGTVRNFNVGENDAWRGLSK